MVTDYALSADGTRIAYDRLGEGSPIILVAAAMQFRAFDPASRELSSALAARGLSVINYDRRGRGDSVFEGGTALDQELEDLRALIEVAGTEVALFGASSGAAICLWAAQAGLPVSRLALWEIPLRFESDEGVFLRGLSERIEADDRAAALEWYMRDMPPEWLDHARSGDAWPGMMAVAPSLRADAEALDRAASGTPWSEQWDSVTQPTMILIGSDTLPIFPPVAEALARVLPHAEQRTIEGSHHSWERETMASTLAEFLRD